MHEDLLVDSSSSLIESSICSMFSSSHSLILRKDFGHRSELGNSKVSARRTGIEPEPKLSQNLIELGPDPDGQREYLDLKSNLL